MILDDDLIINNFYKSKLKKKPNIAVLGLNPHCESVDKFNEDEKIVKPEKKYDHCAILRDTIQDNVIRCKDFETNNIFFFGNYKKCFFL